MTGLLFGKGSITQAQLIAFSLTGLVLLFLLTINIVVWRMYHRAKNEDNRKAKKTQKKKMSDVWVYHVHRPNNTNNARHSKDSASQQILNKLRESHENLRAQIEANEDKQAHGRISQEESQILEELEITADLFLHDTSNVSSRRSSLRSRSGCSISLPDEITNARDFDIDSTLRDLDASTDLRDLDPVSGLRDPDKVSMTSVTKEDFENDVIVEEGERGKRGGRRSKRRNSSRRSNHGNNVQTLPVAEFHNEAFDFAETPYTAVERVQDVEL